MHCEQIKPILNDYLDGSLDQAMRQLIDNHLQNCAGCQRELNALRILWSELPQLPPVDPPAFLHERIMSRVETHIKQQSQPMRVRLSEWLKAYRMAFAGAGAMAVVMISLIAVNPGGIVGGGFGPGGKKGEPGASVGNIVEAVPAWDGVQVVWKEGLPVLKAGASETLEAKLEWSQDGKTYQLLWKGSLSPSQQFEMPLGWLQQVPGNKVNAAFLRWSLGSQTKLLFVPIGFATNEIADLRLRDTFANSLRVIAAQYQQTIIWEMDSSSANPYVVLDVQNSTCENALQKLTQGSYTLSKREGNWVISKP